MFKIAALGLCFVFTVSLHLNAFAQVLVNATGPAGAYNQNFDFLTTVDFGLVDNVTQTGVYAFRASVVPPGPNTFDAETGTDNTGEFNNYGAAGNTDRAMGSLTSGGASQLQYGVRFRNNTGVTITSVQVSYTGEQWRVANINAQTLGFAYRQAATVDDLTTGTYTGVAGLNFVSPTLSASAGALNGNDSANRVTYNVSFNVIIPPGEEIMIRWIDTDDSGSDHGLAIDDLTLVFRAGSTAGDVSVGGRVVSANGRAVGNARITLSGGDLTQPVFAITNPFGYYRFEGLTAGQTYTAAIHSKRHRFTQATRLISPGEDAFDIDFVAEP